ncbi:Osmotin thaumatin-like protein [Trametes polyzona]|nr:Osmotin thaumatin-like protein [Trametes polyzona]
MKNPSILVALAFAAVASARTFTVINSCSYTVWPAIFTDLNVGSSTPDQPTGWEQDPGVVMTFNVPNDWRAGRIWGRRECDFSIPGPNSCIDGGCNGGLECDPHSGTGVPPATLAEFTLGTNGIADNYDVSVVDGFNIPMAITNNKACPFAGCVVDLNPNCESCPLVGPIDPSGAIVGCKSACFAGLGDPVNNPNCCTGTHNTPQTCPPSGVEFYSYFKDSCPDAYVYPFDDAHGGLKTCNSTLQADYTITFCA